MLSTAYLAWKDKQKVTYFMASAIMSELSGMSIILSFEITSVIEFI